MLSTKTESRIGLQDTVQSAVMKLSEGNPGALTACMEMVMTLPQVDPQDIFGGLSALLSLDTNRIYGPRIWMLYKDVCGQNASKAIGLLRARQLGIIYDKELNHAIDNYGAGLDLETVLNQVKERLPQFNLITE